MLLMCCFSVGSAFSSPVEPRNSDAHSDWSSDPFPGGDLCHYWYVGMHFCVSEQVLQQVHDEKNKIIANSSLVHSLNCITLEVTKHIETAKTLQLTNIKFSLQKKAVPEVLGCCKLCQIGLCN